MTELEGNYHSAPPDLVMDELSTKEQQQSAVCHRRGAMTDTRCHL